MLKADPGGSAPPWYSVHMDAIRAMAACVVFLGHARDLFLGTSLRSIYQWAANATPASDSAITRSTVGHQAVIVFFVLSGFLVGGSVVRTIQNGKWSWSDYLLRRLTRLWSVLLPALLIGCAVDWCGLHVFTHPGTIYQGPAGQAEVVPGLHERLAPAVFIGDLLFLQGIWVPSFGTNMPLWSLSYEFWYYLAFPLLVMSVSRVRSARVRIPHLLGLIGVLGFAGWTISAYFLVWLMGVCAYMLPRRVPRAVLPGYGAAALAAFAAANIAALRRTPSLLLSDIITGLSFVLVLYGVLHCRNVSRPGVYRIAAQSISRMSYTLYANHLPFLVLASAILMPAWQRWRLTLSSVAVTGAVVVVVFTICYISYRCFEANTDRLRKVLECRLRRSEPASSRSPGEVLRGIVGGTVQRPLR